MCNVLVIHHVYGIGVVVVNEVDLDVEGFRFKSSCQVTTEVL